MPPIFSLIHLLKIGEIGYLYFYVILGNGFGSRFGIRISHQKVKERHTHWLRKTFLNLFYEI